MISDEAVTWIATRLELQPINILELVTFYPDVSPCARRPAAHSRLPHALVRHGWKLRVA